MRTSCLCSSLKGLGLQASSEPEAVRLLGQLACYPLALEVWLSLTSQQIEEQNNAVRFEADTRAFVSATTFNVIYRLIRVRRCCSNWFNGANNAAVLIGWMVDELRRHVDRILKHISIEDSSSPTHALLLGHCMQIAHSYFQVRYVRPPSSRRARVSALCAAAYRAIQTYG